MMTKVSRVPLIGALLFRVLCLPVSAQERSPIVDQPSFVYATWADHKQAGPLLFSLEKRGTADGNPIHIFFTNVAVKQVGSSTWMDAR